LKNEEVGNISENNYEKISEKMTITQLQHILAEIAKELGGDFEVWLSVDEGGNAPSPMLSDIEFSIKIDKRKRRIVFYPGFDSEDVFCFPSDQS